MRAIIGWAVALAALACVGDDGEDGNNRELTWYTTCGDPVCQGYTGPFAGVSLCDGEIAGEACDDEGAECDPEDDCNARLICASEDPKDQTGGCPRSQPAFKTDVAYLEPAAVEAVAQQALDVRLATWRYRSDDPAAAPHLGFLIDDAAPGAAVREDGERVDLYGYTSLVLAAVQAQHAKIEALEAEIATLRAECTRP